MKMIQPNCRVQFAAEDIDFILSVLAVTGMSMSTAEVVMAGNEQFRRLASDAASAW